MKSRFITGVLLVLLSGMLTANVAVAAPVSLEGSTIDVQLWPEGEPGVSVVIASVTLPESAPLPATVRIPVPEGALVTWAGEISGGGVEQDVQRQHTIVQAEGGQAVEFTVENTRTVQYDATYRAMDVSGDTYSVTLDWVQSVPAKEVAFGVLIPAGVDDVKISPDPPGSPARNGIGESLYSLTPIQLGAGEKTSLDVSYNKLIGGSPSSPSEFPLIPVLIAVLGIAIAALVIALTRSRSRDSEVVYDDEE